jgi:L-iditol 2-dehydrogenase
VVFVKAVQFIESVPRYLVSKVLGSLNRSAYYGPLSCIAYREVPEPALPGPAWVRVKTTLAGVCGSDLNLVYLHDSPATSPFASFPFTFGHENVGVVSEAGPEAAPFKVGDRVVVDPMLSCAAREITPPCPHCREGFTSRCERLRDGVVAPGLLTGSCRDTGGGWSAGFVAHRSQLLRVPDHLSDEAAVLTDPLASALHAVMPHWPADTDTCLVMGAGPIGLCAVAGLRALGSKARIIVVAKHDFQEELARQFGATEVIRLRREGFLEEAARVLGAQALRPMLGKKVILGGADIVYECVGSSRSIDDSLRLTRSGGKVVLVGLAAFPAGVDWTPIWLNELTVSGVFACATETMPGSPGGPRVRTYQVALDLLASGKVDLAPLVTHRFPLSRYRDALALFSRRGREKVVKVVFHPD